MSGRVGWRVEVDGARAFFVKIAGFAGRDGLFFNTKAEALEAFREFCTRQAEMAQRRVEVETHQLEGYRAFLRSADALEEGLNGD